MKKYTVIQIVTYSELQQQEHQTSPLLPILSLLELYMDTEIAHTSL